MADDTEHYSNWSQDSFTLRMLVARLDAGVLNLPLLISVQHGYFSPKEEYSCSEGEVLVVIGIKKQRCILLQDESGKHISIPVSYPARVQTIQDGLRWGSPKSIEMMIEDHPNRTCEDNCQPIYICFEDEATVAYNMKEFDSCEIRNVQFGTMEVKQVYEEAYLCCWPTVTCDETAYIQYSVLPAFLPVVVRVMKAEEMPECQTIMQYIEQKGLRTSFVDDIDDFQDTLVLPDEFSPDASSGLNVTTASQVMVPSVGASGSTLVPRTLPRKKLSRKPKLPLPLPPDDTHSLEIEKETEIMDDKSSTYVNSSERKQTKQLKPSVSFSTRKSARDKWERLDKETVNLTDGKGAVAEVDVEDYLEPVSFCPELQNRPVMQQQIPSKEGNLPPPKPGKFKTNLVKRANSEITTNHTMKKGPPVKPKPKYNDAKHSQQMALSDTDLSRLTVTAEPTAAYTRSVSMFAEKREEDEYEPLDAVAAQVNELKLNKPKESEKADFDSAERGPQSIPVMPVIPVVKGKPKSAETISTGNMPLPEPTQTDPADSLNTVPGTSDEHDEFPLSADISTYSMQKVASVLKYLNLEKYIDQFNHHQINGELLQDLTPDILKESMGMLDIEAVRLVKFQSGWRPQ